MKKYKLLIITALITVSISACGKSNKADSKDSTNQTENNTESAATELVTQEITEESKVTEPANSQDVIGIKLSTSEEVDLTTYLRTEGVLISEYEKDFILTTDYNLKDFKLTQITYAGEDVEYGDVYYEQPEFTTDMALTVTAYIPGTFSNLLVSYVDQEGNNVYYFVMISMDDSSFYLEDASGVIN